MEIAAIFADYNWIPFLFIIAGIIFVIIEMFHPGFGAPGIIGMILLVAGILLYAKTVIQALIMIAVILAILGVALALVLSQRRKAALQSISSWTAPSMMTLNSRHLMTSVTL